MLPRQRTVGGRHHRAAGAGRSLSEHCARACGTLDSVEGARFVVHGLSPRGGRLVTMHREGRMEDDYVGTAFSDHDLLLILRSAGLPEPGLVVDDPRWVEWRGAAAHRWGTG
ncbi:hypothetical protein [Actinacidiphila glaucinigra]|uniref:hypothetical protein n=1 Tax=Actinacidiphila glaucinigra TaxID=235986 RepID=UPI0036E6D6B8